MGTDGSSRIEDRAEELRAEAQELQARLAERLEGLREQAGRADEVVRAFAREKPILAICCAAGLGFLLGRLAARI
ncbi:hypothetical protein [Anaeromyxobacter paludicola]|uniref:DUF883 domain-containing protein n=1 Tax=Anaeromyxobacter paludicola TaxID=2918171 RepID=A0ABM7X5Z5_9BACT|nr:hypothetical protein [Anaeromyxobacter paludicola]BDG07240.1 hypothetical protein AMPC_03530 [Anaeromyxobacter paludicola]